MIDQSQYDLIKQLHEAGFPQVPNGRPYFRNPDTLEYYRIPTLEQLIEETDKFDVFALTHMDLGWRAAVQHYSPEPQLPHADEWYPSKNEAVIGLWLALKKAGAI